jgi:hypothetical protein
MPNILTMSLSANKVGNFFFAFIICNLPFLFLAISPKKPEPSLLLSITINLIIFIIPGLGWLGALRIKQDSAVEIFFKTLFVSSAIVLCVNVATSLIYRDVTFSNYLSFLILLTNAGLILFGHKLDLRDMIKRAARVGKWAMPFLLCLAMLYIFLYSQTARIPPLKDNTLTIQGTAYGLINRLKPYILKDDGMTTYDLAHPTLLHFYAADAILLNNHLNELKYYYDYSLEAAKVKKGPEVGGVFPIYTSEKESFYVKVLEVENENLVLNKEWRNIYLPQAFPNYKLALLDDPSLKIKDTAGGSLIVENRNKDRNIISRTMYEQLRLRQLLKQEYDKFYEKPHSMCTRTVNIFFVMATLFLMFLTMQRLNLFPPYLAFFLCVLYLSLPEVHVRSIAGSYTAISNFFLISIVYFWLDNRRRRLSFFCGFFSGLTEHKLILGPLAILSSSLFTKGKKDITKSLIFGLLAGIALFWLYGLFFVDTGTFLRDHFQHHLINRILHISDLGYAHYPTFLEYWRRFAVNAGWQIFIVGLIGLSALLFSNKDKRLNIFPHWFFLGAIIFSVVDWRDTKHLILIAMPIMFGIGYLIRLLERRKSKPFNFIKIVIMIILGVTGIQNFYFLISENGNHILNKLYIF